MSLAPALGRGLIGRKFCIKLQVLQNNCRKSPFRVQTRLCDQQSARKEGTAGAGKHEGTDKSGLTTTSPAPVTPRAGTQPQRDRGPGLQTGTRRLCARPKRDGAHFGLAAGRGPWGVARGHSAARWAGGGFASPGGRDAVLFPFNRSGNFHTELSDGEQPGCRRGLHRSCRSWWRWRGSGAGCISKPAKPWGAGQAAQPLLPIPAAMLRVPQGSRHSNVCPGAPGLPKGPVLPFVWR